MKAKKLIIGFYFSLIVTCLLSISFSLAWYNAATHLRIDTIELKLRSESSLLISTSGEEGTFKEHLTYSNADLNKVDKFVPVSSMFSDEWINQKKDKPEFQICVATDTDMEGNPGYEKVNYGFYSQEFYLLSDQNGWVGLDSDLTTMLPNHEENLKTAIEYLGGDASVEAINKTTEELDTLAKAMRISILVPDEDQYTYAIYDPYREKVSDEKTRLGGILDSIRTGYYDSYISANQDWYEVIYGEVQNRNLAVYDEKLGYDTELIGEQSCFNAKTRGTVHHFNYDKSVANGLIINEEPSLCKDELDGVEPSFQFKVKENVPQKIVLSLYLEGWDLDCINHNMGGHFLSDISFKIIRHAV